VSPLLLRAVVAASGQARPAGCDGMTLVSAGPIGVWASELPERAEPGRAELLEHHRLVEAICARGACLPARLGSWVESDEEARRLLAAREEALVAALARVEGKVEVAVACRWREESVSRLGRPPASPLPEGEGTRYLRQRRDVISARERREARSQELVALVERAAGVAGAEAQHRICPSEALALSSALLVGRAEGAAAVARLRALEPGDVEVVVNGPWPPYSFAEIA